MDAESKACPLLARTLKAVGAKQMVVGHTVRSLVETREAQAGRRLTAGHPDPPRG
jgi:hypothetical protein